LIKRFRFIKEASSNGAQLIAFPEVFHRRLSVLELDYDTRSRQQMVRSNCIKIPLPFQDPEIDRICKAAKEHNIHIVIGINERGDSLR
jgi:nitrilase